MARLVKVVVCVLFVSAVFREALSCESTKGVEKIVDVLEVGVEDWKGLAKRLKIEKTNSIQISCASHIDKARYRCYMRELVEICCDRLPSGDPRQVAMDIAHVLRDMGKKNQADNLLSLASKLNGTPSEQPSVQQTPVQQTPIQQPPVQQPPAEQPPVQQSPVPVQQSQAEQTPVQQTSVQQSQAEQTSVQQSQAEQTPVQQTSVQQSQAEQTPVQQHLHQAQAHSLDYLSFLGIVTTVILLPVTVVLAICQCKPKKNSSPTAFSQTPSKSQKDTKEIPQLQHGRNGNNETGHIEEDNSGTSPSPSPPEDNCFIKMMKEHCGLIAIAILALVIVILIIGLVGLLLSNRYATSPPLTTEQSSNNQSWDFGVTFGELKIFSSIKNAGTITIIFGFLLVGFIAYLYFVGCEKQKIKQS